MAKCKYLLNLCGEAGICYVTLYTWLCVCRGGGGMNWEIGIDVCALPCVKQIASGNLLYSAGSSAQWSVVT